VGENLKRGSQRHDLVRAWLSNHVVLVEETQVFGVDARIIFCIGIPTQPACTLIVCESVLESSFF